MATNNNYNIDDVRENEFYSTSARVINSSYNRLNFLQRAPAVFIFDISGSMQQSLPTLKSSVRRMLLELREALPANGELAVLVFGSIVVELTELTPIDLYTDAVIEQLTHAFDQTLGTTYTALALKSALALIDSRKELYECGSYPPVILTVTDGLPVPPADVSEEQAEAELDDVCRELKRRAALNEINSIVLGLNDGVPFSPHQVEVFRKISTDVGGTDGQPRYLEFGKVDLSRVIRYATSLVVSYTQSVTGGASAANAMDRSIEGVRK